ncbi:MAG: L-seryl-tRNA(Sec) selenium transferase [Candidatus Dormibacteraeota bacterium]|nr:L-seryl-tRNA(Sec) selenium transferase [Candidatus Dormibacteraeota bacterium]
MQRISRARSLPAVGTLLNQPGYARLLERFPHDMLAAALRDQLALERAGEPATEEARLSLVESRLRDAIAPSLRHVINATGVVLHTNLGRAPLGPPALLALAEVAAGYANLELDLATGRRGERAAHVSSLLKRLTGAPAALVVNNNAGAILLALSALSGRREVIVSRGEQVEIGGSFRMPDVMRLSGARMVEVGTTNRTRAADYEAAITPRTAAILRVHTSNYRVTGFTEAVALPALAAVARRHGVLLLDDIGSGSLIARSDEPSVAESVKHADIVTFSGDKLLGGPQAGIALGAEAAIARMAKHPLARALRIDKLSLAALEATLRQWVLGRAEEEVPVERMLAATPAELRRRAAWLGVKLGDRGISSRLIDADSAAGGGSLPGQPMATTLVGIEGPASRLLKALREGEPPVIARVEADLCCLDPRTILRGEEEALLGAVARAVALLSS